MKTTHHIITGDARDMRSVADASVHLVVTSPPYWQLKDYGGDGQIGFDDSYESYINNLNLVWQECHRVLRGGCRLCVNIGDQFARSVYYGRYKVIPIRTEIIRFCETIGFDYMGAVIWQKVITSNTTGGATVMGSYPYPNNGILKLDYEFILLFKKLGDCRKVAKAVKEESKMSKEEWNTYFHGHWNFRGEKQDKHLAMFPLELPRRLIKMFSFVGDTVLDPFLGSGTTCLAAMNLRRNSLGYEVNEAFLPVIERKLGVSEPRMFEEAVVTFDKDEQEGADYAKMIAGLPYVFSDPVKIERKVNPKTMRFGSKIDGVSDGERNTYFSVREVHSANELTLNTGLRVKLIGVKPIAEKAAAAKAFLREQTRRQKVFLEFDEKKHDENNRLLCYLYLKNKTFINGRLIKGGYAAVDNGVQHRRYQRFLSYEKEGQNA